jgi:putative sigma-54 modulation protein
MTRIQATEDSMRLDIRCRRLTPTPALLEYVARRLRFALGRFDHELRRVTVRLGDINGPRGGVDKSCRVQLHAAGRSIAIEDCDPDLYVAIDRAAERARRAVDRAVSRLRAA